MLIKSQINTSNAGYNQDAILTKSEMHPITSKLDQNINQKPDQQIKTRSKLDTIRIQFRFNLDAIQMQC